MGTHDHRSSASTEYYKRGDYIPGIWVDGMDVLAVKNATEFALDYCPTNGPLVIEMETCVLAEISFYSMSPSSVC